MSNSSQKEDAKQETLPRPAWLDVVRRNVESLRFGVVQIVVHDSRVIQIDRTEKTRLDTAKSCQP